MADKPKSFPAGTPFAGPKYDQRVVVDPVTAANIAGKQADTQKTQQAIRLRELEPQTTTQKARAAEQLNYARKMGTSLAGIEAALPQRRLAAQTAIDQLDTFIKHPGFNAIMGWPNPFKGGFGLFNLPDSDAARAEALYDTIKGTQFAGGAELLRGLGSMALFEGQQAARGLASLDKLSGERGFKEGAQTYANRLKNAVDSVQKTVNTAKAAMRPSREAIVAESRRRGMPIPGEDE